MESLLAISQDFVNEIIADWYRASQRLPADIASLNNTCVVLQPVEQAEVGVDKARKSASRGVKAAGKAAGRATPKARPGGTIHPSPPLCELRAAMCMSRPCTAIWTGV